MTPVLHISDITYQYRGRPAQVLEGVSFDLLPGEVFGLLGPNGAGKSTLMALIAGLLVPQGGVIRRAPELAEAGGLALVPQDNAFYPMLSCRENLEFFGGVLGLHGRVLAGRMADAVEATGLGQVLDRRAGECSGGLRRRLNLAIGLVADPRVLLLDEPTTGVDPQSRGFLLDVVLALKRRGRTILYTSHYMDEVQRVSDRVAIMDHGKVLCCGALDALLAEAGGRSLQVRTRRAPSAGERALLARECGMAAEDTDGWLQFTPSTETGFDGVLAALRRMDLQVTALQSGCRNLEELFFRFTHRSLRDE